MKKYLEELYETYESDSFRWFVITDLLDERTEEDTINKINNVLEHGCVSGCVNSLIYYRQTHKVFKEYFNNILEILEEYDIKPSYNYNDMVWSAYECIVKEIVDNKY